MTCLQYYLNERSNFPLEFASNLDFKITDKIVRKLIGHFKIYSHNDWRFTGCKSSHCVTWKNTGKGYFKFSRKHTSLGVICHELAHAIDINKRGTSTHSKKHYIIMKRLIKYCRKNKYIKNLIAKQTISIVAEGNEKKGMSAIAFKWK